MTYVEDLKATIAAVEKECGRIAAWLRALPAADWERPTFCPGWSAGQVVLHMATSGPLFADSIRNALKGHTGLPFGAKDAADLGRIREAQVQEIAALPPAGRVDRFEANTLMLHGVFASLKPGDYDRRAWHRRGLFPIRRFIISRLYELLLHEWDIRNRPGAPLEQESVPVAGANLRQHFPLFYEMDPVPGLSGAFAFRLTDTGKRWAMRVSDKKAEDLGPGDHEADVTFSAAAGDMVLLSSGRGSLDQRRREGRFQAEGDAARASAIIPKLFFPL